MFFPVGNRFLGFLRFAAEHDGNEDWQEGEADGNERQQRTVPQHQAQRAGKREGGGEHVLQRGKEIPLDGGDVVGKGGQVEGAVFPGKRLDAFVQQPAEDVFPVLFHGLCAEAGKESVIDHRGQRHQRDAAPREGQQGPERVSAEPGNQVDDFLDQPGDDKLPRGHEDGGNQGHRKVGPVLPEKLPQERTAKRLEILPDRFILTHCFFPPSSACGGTLLRTSSHREARSGSRSLSRIKATLSPAVPPMPSWTLPSFGADTNRKADRP